MNNTNAEPQAPAEGPGESADTLDAVDAEMSGAFAPDYFEPCFVCQIDGDTGELLINPSTYSSWVVSQNEDSAELGNAGNGHQVVVSVIKQ